MNKGCSSKKNSSVAKWWDIRQTEIMPYVVGDRTDFQPRVNSMPQSWRLRPAMVVKSCKYDVSPSAQGMIVFIKPTVYHTLALFICAQCMGLSKTNRSEQEHVASGEYKIILLVCKQMSSGLY